jgi:hypothetical protein
MALTTTTIALVAGWNLVTTTDTSGSPRLVVEDGADCRVMATVGAVPPVNFLGSIPLIIGEKHIINLAVDFVGTPTANRLYVWSGRDGRCSISHA